MEFVFSLRLCGFSPGTPASSHSPKTCKQGVNWSLKLSIGVNVSVNVIVDGCMSLCQPCDDELVISPSPHDAEIDSSNPLQDKQ